MLREQVGYLLGTRPTQQIKSLSLTTDFESGDSYRVGDFTYDSDETPIGIISFIEEVDKNCYRFWKTCRFTRSLVLVMELTIPPQITKSVHYFRDEQEWLDCAFRPLIDDDEGSTNIFVGNGLHLFLMEEAITDEPLYDGETYIHSMWFDFDGNEVKEEHVMVPFAERPRKKPAKK